ncbi:MAG: methyltransferase domain-containing protein [Candidatus Bathyarchaeota archaeon]|nr:methyltransferase domain-containing protein [Candidatus Bathyarchaeota archaeon]
MQNAKENKSYVTAEYLKKRAHDEDAVNQESYRMLHVEAGMQVLELGCGPGTAVPSFSEAAGSDGLVVGVDCDSKMIQQAKTTSKTYPNVTKLVGDAHRLPFEVNTFDRVYAKRLFQVLPPSSASQLFGEMQRVLKPGGILLMVDTDWTSVAVNYSDLEVERRLMGFFRDYMRPNGLAGRQLLGLTQQGCFTYVAVKVMQIIIRDFNETPFNNWLIGEALKAKIATVPELEKWRSELEQKTAQQTFLFHVGTILVSAKKENP